MNSLLQKSPAGPAAGNISGTFQKGSLSNISSQGSWQGPCCKRRSCLSEWRGLRRALSSVPRQEEEQHDALLYHP